MKKKSKMKVKVFEWWTAVLNNPLWLHLTPLQDLKWKVCCYFQDKRQKNRKIANRTGSYKSSEIIMETIRHGFSFYFASATSSYVIKTKKIKELIFVDPLKPSSAVKQLSVNNLYPLTVSSKFLFITSCIYKYYYYILLTADQSYENSM